jgi:prenyltransferase beta subunit
MLDKTIFTVHRHIISLMKIFKARVANLNTSAHRHASHLTNTIFTINETYIINNIYCK